MGTNQSVEETLALYKVDGHKLVVKNTFIDVEVPAQPQLLRQRTAPVLAGGRTGIELFDDECEEGDICQCVDSPSESEEELGVMTDVDLIAPDQPDLRRMKTFDAFEGSDFFPGSIQHAQHGASAPLVCSQLHFDPWMNGINGMYMIPQLQMGFAEEPAEAAPPPAPLTPTTQASEDITSDQEWETLEEPPEPFQPQ